MTEVEMTTLIPEVEKRVLVSKTPVTSEEFIETEISSAR